jgi:MGT family glycosyltransferase
MSKHFVFVSAPGHGHVNPTLPLVRELVRRGHRVSYPVAEPFRAAVTGAGAEFIEVAPWDRPQRPPGKFEFTVEMAAMMLSFVTADAQQNLPNLVARFEADRPDAVCYDVMSPIGPMLAALLDVPAIQMLPSFASNEHYSLLAEFDPSVQTGDPTLTAAQARLRESVASFGVTRPVGTLFAPVVEDLNLVFVPREFQHAGETFDDRYAFIGPSVGGREAPTDEWQPPAPGTPLLFISLGTAMNNNPEFFSLCLEAFGGTDWQVAMSVGDQVRLDNAAANFDVRPHFPQPAVLQHATAFVTHAGMNSTMEALYYEVPTVSAPQMPEQAANARRVEELGLGRRLPADLTAAALRGAVDAVAHDPKIRANLADMAMTIGKAGGAPAGADAIEALLARG